MEESTTDELDRDEAENKENIIAKVQKIMQDGCGCRRGIKSGQCSDQFTEDTILQFCPKVMQAIIDEYRALFL